MGITGSRQMQRILGIHVIIVVVLGFAMSSACAESPGPKVTTFDVGGLMLSMPIDDFRQLYPDAEVTKKAAIRYCYGEEIQIDFLSHHGAVVRRSDAIVHITFDYKIFGQGISTIERDEVIEFDLSQFTSLRDGLVRHYGPYTGIKYPNKLDPAGLVVGFEWAQQGVASLAVTIHRDHADDSGNFRQKTYLTRSLPGMEDNSLAAAYYRDAVQSFRKNCTRR